MNILILSAGTRNKIVRYFKDALNGAGIVVATDMNKLGPAIYDADKHYIVPAITDPRYIDTIVDICIMDKIQGVLSLIDPELSLLAKNHERFESIGVTVIGSSYELCEMSLDKMKMIKWLNDHNYSFPKSWDDKEVFYNAIENGDVDYPVFVKPIKGSASLGISRVINKEMVDALFLTDKDLMIQEFMDGQEIGADIYIDMISGEVVSIFTKKKIKMRAGETDKSVSIKDDKSFGFIERFVQEAGFRGQIDIDIFEKNGEYLINEVNPRFGGGYPHAYECGVDHMRLIIENLKGNVNKKCIGDYDESIYMMKYNDVMML